MDKIINPWSIGEKSFRRMFNNFNRLRKSYNLCDVILKCEGEKFYAHRIILSSCSDYFYAMFTNEVIKVGSFILQILIYLIF